ncbi:hypothetical protein BS78_07G010300 [Paspalum vaginatum]|nr:hypothetical protein BS78_07G010300 [Paspalum vaginatum]
MGRRKKRAKQCQQAAAAAVEDDSSDVARLIRGLPALSWLLFETPSGFAVFSFRNSILKEEDAMEHIWARFVKDYMANFLWLKQFLEFEGKSAAISRTAGLDKQLGDMLKIWTRPGETLVVGSLEHKEISEADQELGVTCWYDDCVMEMMWGMKNLMRSLVPQEQKVLTKEERLPLSKGLQMILDRYNFDVKPEMVNDDIVETACFLYDCDLIEKKHSRDLHMSDILFMEISGLNSQDWSPMKLAIAHVKIAYPEIRINHPPEMFSPEELSKIENDREMYNEKFITCSILDYYDGLVSAYICKEEKLSLMNYLVGVAQGAAKGLDQAVV